MTIIIDTNEFSHDPKTWKPVVHKIDNLEVDFLIQGEVANFGVERKEFKDLKASICGDERLWNQCKALRQLKEEQGYTVFVACVGDRMEYDTRFRRMVETMTEEQFTGVQIGIARNNVSFIHFAKNEHLIAFLKNLDGRSGTAREYVRPTIRKPERTMTQERADMVSAIKGIGMKTATSLVEETGSIVNLCSLVAIDSPIVMKHLNKNSKGHIKEVLLGEADSGQLRELSSHNKT